MTQNLLATYLLTQEPQKQAPLPQMPPIDISPVIRAMAMQSSAPHPIFLAPPPAALPPSNDSAATAMLGIGALAMGIAGAKKAVDKMKDVSVQVKPQEGKKPDEGELMLQAMREGRVEVTVNQPAAQPVPPAPPPPPAAPLQNPPPPQAKPVAPVLPPAKKKELEAKFSPPADDYQP